MRSIIDSVQELAVFGLVKEASAQIRVHHCAPLFKLYILNGEETFFGFYPVREHTVTLGGEPHSIYDLMVRTSSCFTTRRRAATWSTSSRLGSGLTPCGTRSVVSSPYDHARAVLGPQPDHRPYRACAPRLRRPHLQHLRRPVAQSIAAELRNLLLAERLLLPPRVAEAHDPLKVLRFTSDLDSDLTERVDSALRAAELVAAQRARPTPYARETILACRHTHRTVAVVSNNSTPAVEAYLTAHDLIDSVNLIVGRTEPNPALLKPHPHLILRAVQALGADPAACTLIGDSPSDIEASLAAGVRSIGYANKPGKHERLASAGADAVVTTMTDLASAFLTPRSLPGFPPTPRR
jgi:HAD superfamily hydrolase (TIGR01509 family)